MPLKIDNRDGVFSPRNPHSPYDLSVNTPVRLWLPGGVHFLDLDGSDTSYASTPDHAALDITGDLDLRWEGEASWYSPGAQMLLGKWGDSGNRSYHMRIQDGSLYISGITSGGESYFVSRPLPALPERAALRVTLDADTGAGSWAVAHYWAPTIAGPWTQIHTTFTAAGTITTHVSTAPLLIAPAQPTATVPRRVVEGKVYAAEVRSGIGGTLVAAPVFTAQPLGTAGFTDSAGRVWSYSGAASIADRQEIFVGEIANWPQRWVPSGQAVWAPVQAAGILRRLNQGQRPLDSTLRRRIPSANPIAYWPFEEDTLASRAYSPIAGVTPAAVTGVEWAAVDTLPSSRALPRLTAAATLSAVVPDAADGQWQVECVYNADDKAPPSSGPRAEILSVSTTGTVRRWVISMRAGSAHVAGFNAAGTDVVNQGVSLVDDPFHGWYRLRFYVQDLGGGQMEWVIGWANVNGSTLQLAKNITASAGHVTAVTANWGPLTEGWSVGHLSVMPAAAGTIYDGSDNAYAGETAWVRMRRLAGEEGVPMARIPGDLPVERVGPQRVAKLVELFQAAASADGGLLLEDRRRPGLVYRDRSSMYTQDPALTLVYGQPGLAPPLEPDDEADIYRNDRTVVRDGGSEARAVLETGKLSVQAPPAGIGLYDDSVTLSLADDVQAEPIAYWRLYHGTYDGARYPAVTVKLHRAPHLIPAVLRMREGDIIRLKSLPGHVSYGDIDLLVTGWTETLLPRTWTRTFTCEPGGPWDLANINVVREGFEDGVYEVTITNGGNLPWTRTSAQAHSGTNSLRSGAIGNNQTSDAAVSVPAGATSFSFWYRTSSENSGPGFEGDRLLVLVDGVQVLRAQGTVGWTKFTVDVTGKSVVLFRYAKDNSASAGEDAVYIDDLRFIVGAYQPTKALTDGSELAAGIDADDLTLSVAVTAGPRWTTDANEMPILIDVGGEHMSVTAISGTSSPQTFTIGARSVNGVTKAHSSGTPVTLARRPPASL
ncbi:hypothetical protein [Streptomyces neyagawaensis]|uniref:hypothetical protein n=1 Tax=Streptomyces neyagawaensis TaxID=42238 RepID=UPI00197D5151|nr:hypothetical protein [Streptomyces neyagawaensis]